jgi:hypothetical protein
MKEKILAALKTKYSSKGFSAKTLESVADYLAATVSDENNIDTAVTGVEPLLSVFQSETDSRVNAAVAKAKTDTQQQNNPPAGANQGNGTQNSNANQDVPSWAKQLIDANEHLQKSLAALQGERITTTRQQTLNEKLKEAPEPYRNKILKDFKRMQFNSDEDFNSYLEETEMDAKEAVQKLVDDGLGNFPKPNGSQSSSTSQTTAKSEIETWAKRKVEESKIS